MADINVERKSGSIWPWILGALALLLILWLLFSLLGRDREEVVVDQAPIGVVADTMAMAPVVPVDPGPGVAGPIPAEVQQFEQTCAAAGTTQQQASLSHDYTIDCTRRLTTAIEAVVRHDTVGGTALEPRLAEMRQRVEAIGNNPQATNHANLVRDAFTSIATVMNTVQETRPGMSPALGQQVSGVRDAAQGISPTTELLNQKDQVDAFFRRAGEALRSMAS